MEFKGRTCFAICHQYHFFQVYLLCCFGRENFPCTPHKNLLYKAAVTLPSLLNYDQYLPGLTRDS